MNVKRSVLCSALCFAGIGVVCAPARADDAASNAVKQCFLNMQSVHSYRMKTVTITPGFSQVDQDVLTEGTEDPPRLHVVTTISAIKYEHEVVTTDSAIYIRVNGGTWQAQVIAPHISNSWGASWSDEYDPHATYAFKRKDTLDSIPVNVYSTDGVVDGQHADTVIQTGVEGQHQHANTEIWIGAKDHLPHEILTHSVQDDKTEHYITETLSDFNAPITITVPDVTPSAPATDQAQPSGSQ